MLSPPRFPFPLFPPHFFSLSLSLFSLPLRFSISSPSSLPLYSPPFLLGVQLVLYGIQPYPAASSDDTKLAHYGYTYIVVGAVLLIPAAAAIKWRDALFGLLAERFEDEHRVCVGLGWH